MLSRGKIARPKTVTVYPLTRDDLARLEAPRYNSGAPQRIKESHHKVCRLSAAGLTNIKIAGLTGYSLTRVGQILGSPAGEELVAQYRKMVNEAFVESQEAFVEMATANMLAAERHISDHIAELDEAGELLPVKTALAISRDAADRLGFGKRSTNVNVNVDFAAQLEAARRRSGRERAREGGQGDSQVEAALSPAAAPMIDITPEKKSA